MDWMFYVFYFCLLVAAPLTVCFWLVWVTVNGVLAHLRERQYDHYWESLKDERNSKD